jgi:hypothetical protein
MFDATTMERVIDPAMADFQREGRSVRGYVALIKVIALCVVGGCMSRPASWPPDDRRFLVKAILWSTVFIVALMALFDRPSRYAVPQVLRVSSPLPIFYLAPAALSMAFTIGATFGVMVALRGREITGRIAATVLALALALSMCSFVNLGWIAPEANRKFAVLVAGSPGDPGIGEMTLGELARTIDRFSDPVFAQFGYLHALQYHYHGRVALAWSPAVFAILMLSLAAAFRRRWVVALAACGGWYFIAFAPELRPWNSGLSPFVAAWSGNFLVLCVSTVALLRYGVVRLKADTTEPASPEP